MSAFELVELSVINGHESTINHIGTENLLLLAPAGKFPDGHVVVVTVTDRCPFR